MWANKFENLDEVYKYLGKYNAPKMTQGEIENLHSSI